MASAPIAVFPGSFDPFTYGHHDIVLRAMPLFSKLIIAIGHNPEKTRCFDIRPMRTCLQALYASYPHVHIETYNMLTADFAKQKGAAFLLRGLRNINDFEAENKLLQVNRALNTALETVLFTTSPRYAAISSSLIREVHRYGGDISSFLPYALVE